MRTDGACLLKGFVAPDRLGKLVEEAEAPVGAVHYNVNTTRPYKTTVPQAQSAEHPTRRPRRFSAQDMSYDLIPPTHGKRLLYERETMRNFLTYALKLPWLYRCEDPLAELKHCGQ